MALHWSCCVVREDAGIVIEDEADIVRPTASVGKLFLLCEAAEQITDGRLDPHTLLTKDPAVAATGSGLWQYLAQESLPLADVCILIASVSDNWATNVLLDRIGLPSVQARAVALDCDHSRLHDYVRDHRRHGDVPLLSSGTARELALVARRIHLAAAGIRVDGISRPAAALVEEWLRTGVDLSLVAMPLRLDPLEHVDGPPLLWNKTGSDIGVRADVGVVWQGDRFLAYAAIATWDPDDEVLDKPFELLHALGHTLRQDQGTDVTHRES